MSAPAVQGGTDVLLSGQYSHGRRINSNAYEHLSESAPTVNGTISKPFTASIPSGPLELVERIWFADVFVAKAPGYRAAGDRIERKPRVWWPVGLRKCKSCSGPGNQPLVGTSCAIESPFGVG